MCVCVCVCVCRRGGGGGVGGRGGGDGGLGGESWRLNAPPPDLAYLCSVWGQPEYSLNRINLLQKRAIRILEFPSYRDPACNLFRRYTALTFIEHVSLENSIFANKCFNDDVFPLFSNHFNCK